MPEFSSLGPSWPDLVFHVLAHVPVPRAVPASLHRPDYATWVASRLGPATRRPLGEDARNLARVFADHRRLAHVQLLAFLFDGLDAAQAASARPLSTLGPEDGCDMAVLKLLLRDPVSAELLWASALLELPAYAGLPHAELAQEAFLREVSRAIPAGPHLAACRLAHARALGPHGRVLRDHIWLGLPTDPQHTAWQAAHEATVAEVRGHHPDGAGPVGQGPPGQALGEREQALGAREQALGEREQALGAREQALGERDVEGVALALMAERARAAGLRAEHRRWRDSWGIAPEHCLPSALAPAQRARFDALK